MAGQVGVRNGRLTGFAVHEVQQVAALDEDALEALDGLQTDAVGLVGVAVLVHQLGSIAVSLCFLGLGQLTAQLVKTGFDGGVQLQILLGLVGNVVADSGCLAAVGIGGDGLFQEALDVGGVLIGGSEAGGGLVRIVLGQQIQAGGDLRIPDAAHGVRGGDDAARKAEHQRGRAEKGKKFLFHNSLLLICIKPLRSAHARTERLFLR